MSNLNLKSKSIEMQSDQDIYLAAQLSEIDMIQFILNKKYKAVINTSNEKFQIDYQRSQLIEVNKLNYIHSPEKYIFNNNARFKVISIKFGDEKAKVLHEVTSYCDYLNSKFIEESVRAIFEELYMNAIYDAPREAGILNQQSKTHCAEFLIGNDGENLVISCLDYFGSLNPEKFFDRLYKVKKYGTGQVINLDHRLGGAGIGCSILYENCTNLIVAVSPQKFTRVTCIIPLKTSRKKFANISKNIQLVVI